MREGLIGFDREGREGLGEVGGVGWGRVVVDGCGGVFFWDLVVGFGGGCCCWGGV